MFLANRHFSVQLSNWFFFFLDSLHSANVAVLYTENIYKGIKLTLGRTLASREWRPKESNSPWGEEETLLLLQSKKQELHIQPWSWIRWMATTARTVKTPIKTCHKGNTQLNTSPSKVSIINSFLSWTVCFFRCKLNKKTERDAEEAAPKLNFFCYVNNLACWWN